MFGRTCAASRPQHKKINIMLLYGRLYGPPDVFIPHHDCLMVCARER